MTDYPEKIPTNIKSIDTFPFSFQAAKTARKELEAQRDSVDERINKIVDHFIYSDVPILSYILRLTDEKSDLKKMSKAIDRLADLIEIKNKVDSKIAVINAVQSDPTWLTATFADYSSEIEDDISSIFNEE